MPEENCTPFIDNKVGTCRLCLHSTYASQKLLDIPVREDIWWTPNRIVHAECAGDAVCVRAPVWRHSYQNSCGASRRIIQWLCLSETCFDAEC